MIDYVIRNGILIGAVLIIFSLQALFPYFENYKTLLHTFRNGLLIIINAILVNIFLVPIILFATSLDWGLFAVLGLPIVLEFIFTLLIIDFVTYVMHVAFHKIPLLWRFHKMHHSDTEMDVTTGLRFHIGEHAISVLVRCLVYASFAMQLELILLYEVIFLINVFFHHANISLGEKWDRVYRVFFTSPNMHKVHHSNKQIETDSNYTSLFSFWDRIFGTYRIVRNPKRITYGIEGLEDDQTVVKMFKTPFKK